MTDRIVTQVPASSGQNPGEGRTTTARWHKFLQFVCPSFLLLVSPCSAFGDRVIYWNEWVVERNTIVAGMRHNKEGEIILEIGMFQGTFGNSAKILCKDKIDKDQLVNKILPALATYIENEKRIVPYVFLKSQGLKECRPLF